MAPWHRRHASGCAGRTWAEAVRVGAATAEAATVAEARSLCGDTPNNHHERSEGGRVGGGGRARGQWEEEGVTKWLLKKAKQNVRSKTRGIYKIPVHE